MHTQGFSVPVMGPRSMELASAEGFACCELVEAKGLAQPLVATALVAGELLAAGAAGALLGETEPFGDLATAFGAESLPLGDLTAARDAECGGPT